MQHAYLDELLPNRRVVMVHVIRPYIHSLYMTHRNNSRGVIYPMIFNKRTWGKAFLVYWATLFSPIVGIVAALRTNCVWLSWTYIESHDYSYVA
mgnify:CR=1 FL=1